MKRLGLMFALLVLVLVVAAIPAAAEDHEPPPLHPHMLLQRPEFGPVGDGFGLVAVRKCVDLAANQALPLNSHHAHIHTGGTGISIGNELSGHWVVPLAPFLPFWENCEDLEESLPFQFPEE